MQTYAIIPQVPTGYALNTKRGALSVVVPEATTNLVTNPSFETNTTSWAGHLSFLSFDRAVGGSRGVYYLAVVPGIPTMNGARYTFGASVALSGIYTLSFDVFAEEGATIRALVQNTVVAEVRGRGAGNWFRVVCAPIPVSSAGSAVIDIKRSTTSAGTSDILGIDGVQLEQKGYATTYCDGDQVGFLPNEAAYSWAVSPHASTSSRLATTRAGGRVYNLQDLGALITSIAGLSLPQPSIISTPIMTGGTFYQRTVAQERAFSLTTIISGANEQDLDQQRSLITQYLSPWMLNQAQPMRLIYEAYDACGVAAVSKQCDLVCHYAGGLEGLRDNNHQERAAPTFVMPEPWIARFGNRAAGLVAQTDVSATDGIAVRSRLGVWSDVAAGVTGGAVLAMVRGLDGLIYVGGSFTSAGGVANTNGIARYNPSTAAWSACGTGAAVGGVVRTLAVGTAGNIYAGGSFTSMGGVANTRFIARWNVSTGAWASIGTTAGGTAIYVLAIAPAGVLYAGGDFTTIGGTAATRIASLNIGTGAWSAMGTGANDVVRAIAVSQDGSKVYAGGDFSSAGGVANTDNIALWTVASAAWSALSTGATNDSIHTLAFGSNGVLYIGGEFTTLGGQSIAGIGYWNGVAFTQLGAGLGSTAWVQTLAFDQTGLLHIGGANLNIYGTSYGTESDCYALWNGSTFVPPDIDTTSYTLVYAILPLTDGSLYLGFDFTGDSVAAGTVTIDYGGTAPSYPTFIITGPTSGEAMRLYHVANTTTDTAIYFDVALTISEVLTLDLDPRSATYGLTSSQRGNMISAIMPGSNLRDFYLQPGDNVISVRTEAGSMTASMTFRILYAAIEHAAVA